MSARDVLGPVHLPFSWLPSSLKDDSNAKFATNVMDVSYGGAVIANLVRRNSMASDNGAPPLLSGPDLDSLVGLLIFSLDTLRDAAEEQIDRLEATASEGSAS